MEDDLRDKQGGTYDTPQGGPKKPVTDKDGGPSEKLSEDMPEGMQRPRKGPLGPITGRR